MKSIAAFAILLLSSPAHAAGCDAWTAQLEEDEGGPVMTARICSGTGDATHELSFRCGAQGSLMIRFIPAAPAGYPPNDGNYQTRIEFLLNTHRFTRDAHYEDMDGAMAMETTIGDSLVEGMFREAEIALSDAKGKVPAAKFTLDGAKQALEKLTRTCEK